MKKLWSGIKLLSFIKIVLHLFINRIIDKIGNMSSDPAEISNIFNDYFVSVADFIAERISRTPKSALDYLRNKNFYSIFLSPATHMEIEDMDIKS